MKNIVLVSLVVALALAGCTFAGPRPVLAESSAPAEVLPLVPFSSEDMVILHMAWRAKTGQLAFFASVRQEGDPLAVYDGAMGFDAVSQMTSDSPAELFKISLTTGDGYVQKGYTDSSGHLLFEIPDEGEGGYIDAFLDFGDWGCQTLSEIEVHYEEGESREYIWIFGCAPMQEMNGVVG